mmetsp:Transcript_36017/g.84292  ORF Transcript_36017/g.84292 Transcript_36017/m.84292 type:complete len:227 (-) Transcript_36017:75-755(-)
MVAMHFLIVWLALSTQCESISAVYSASPSETGGTQTDGTVGRGSRPDWSGATTRLRLASTFDTQPAYEWRASASSSSSSLSSMSLNICDNTLCVSQCSSQMAASFASRYSERICSQSSDPLSAGTATFMLPPTIIVSLQFDRNDPGLTSHPLRSAGFLRRPSCRSRPSRFAGGRMMVLSTELSRLLRSFHLPPPFRSATLLLDSTDKLSSMTSMVLKCAGSFMALK